MNLFTNSMVALRLDTGKLAWHFQAIHHDIWDWDLATGPVLFDVDGGRPDRQGRRLARRRPATRTCSNRETGTAAQPDRRDGGADDDRRAGRARSGRRSRSRTRRTASRSCRSARRYPIVTDPELAKRVRPSFHPYLVNEFVITAPGNIGGSNYGSPSFSPRTGLLLRHRQERRVVDQGEAGRRHAEAGTGQHGSLQRHRRAGQDRGDADAGVAGLRSGDRAASLVRSSCRTRRTPAASSRPATSSSSRAGSDLYADRRAIGQAAVPGTTLKRSDPREPADLPGGRPAVRRDRRRQYGSCAGGRAMKFKISDCRFQIGAFRFGCLGCQHSVSSNLKSEI